MKRLSLSLLRVSARLRHRAVFFANEAASPVLDAIAEMVANEVKEDGWVQLSPFGRFPNAQGMQEFAREDAEAIVNEFESLKGAPQRLLGLPWYIGHPDHPRFADKYKDTRAYGRIKALEVRDEGLFANVKWSAAGRQLVEDGAFHGHSVNWKVRKVGAVFRPFSLKSVGFTNDPQIPVQPALANETQTTPDMLPKWLIDMLVAAGALKADAAAPTEEEAKALLAPFFANSAKAATAEADKAKADTALANEVAAHGVTKGRLATVETSFANERKAHVASLLSAAELAGRLKPADRAQFETEFANEFGAAAARLAALKPGLKTERTTVPRLGTPELSTSTQARRERTRQMVNERMKTNGGDYDEALTFVTSSQRTN